MDRTIDTHNSTTMGRLHRCNLCWPWVTGNDNGFVPVDTQIQHHIDCPTAREAARNAA